ncbi:hypothetical protein RSOLAG22IIIB_01210 [Rhizoctonia solani]|uniref:Uncharacterized protein n=1 Tax=Rhizoctonia solani TaxID=456999 RepID=A0A0K6G5C6_9AGAM|nr:hypothetical protein RSOLAG22IIIB_01210 [Rhizoctonia solani]
MAQTTTKKTTHTIVKYASHKTPLSAQVPTNEIQWKSHEGDHLRLTVSVTTTRTDDSNTQPTPRHVLKIVYLSEDSEETQNASQGVASEALLENLDLTSFSESEIKFSGRELPLKAVYKNRSVAFRYLHPMIQNDTGPQTYRRFQVTFKTAGDALSFVNSIQYICPCSTARDQRTTETQATDIRPSGANRPITPSQISNPPALKNTTTYRKSTMFADMLSSQSLGSSQSERASGARTTMPDRRGIVSNQPIMVVDNETMDERGDSDRIDTANMSRVGMEPTPSPIQPEPNVSAPGAGTDQVQVSSRSSVVEIARSAEGGRDESSNILSAIRQGDSDLYKLSFEELEQLVGEVIREPGFPELVGRVNKMWKEKGLVEVQLAGVEGA